MCESCDDAYTLEYIYQPQIRGYPQSCPQRPLQPAAGCGILVPLAVDTASCRKGKVEMQEKPRVCAPAVEGISFLKDPHLREIYAPYIRDLQAIGLCGR